MTFIITLGVITLVLFTLSFISNRRFGVHGLSLVAGSTLATLWSSDVAMLVAGAGVSLTAPPLETVVVLGLTLLPALILLGSGHRARSKLQRMIGALLYAALAIALLYEPLTRALVIDGPGQQLQALIAQYRVVLITACLVIAVLDLMFTKTVKPLSKH